MTNTPDLTSGQYGWTLNKRCWEVLTDLTAETKWTKIYLEKIYQDTVPTKPGVYLICARLRSPKQQPFSDFFNMIYAGRAGSLKRRFLDHCNSKQPEIMKAKDCFPKLEFWFSCIPNEFISNVEACVHTCFRPSACLRLEPIKGRIQEPIKA